MPKPTTELSPEQKDVPFYFVRVSPALLAAIEEKRLLMGFNKRKSVEVMGEWFINQGAYPTVTPSLPLKKAAKKAKKKK